MESMTPSEAAAALFEQYGNEVYRFIRYTVGTKSDADDILQDVFLRVLQNWNRFKHESSSKTWLWAIAKNCIREYFRRQKRIPRHATLNDQIRDPRTKDVITDVLLEEGLLHLTIPQREVFVERIVNEHSTADTAKLLGWSESKVKVTLHRAIHVLKNSFLERETHGE